MDTYANGPGANFILARCEEVHQIQRMVAGSDDLGQSALHLVLYKRNHTWHQLHTQSNRHKLPIQSNWRIITQC